MERPRLSVAGRANLQMTGAVLVASFLSQVWLGRRAGTTGLGEYNATLLFLTVMSILMFFGLPYAITQRLAMAEESGDRTGSASVVAGGLTLALVLGSLGAVIAGSLWGPFTALTRLDAAAPSLLVAIAVFALIFQYFQVNVQLARLQIGRATYVTVTQPAVVAGGVALSYVGVGPDGSLLAALGGVGTGLAALVFFVAEPVRPTFDAAPIRTLLQSSVSGTTVLYISLLTSWVDRLAAVTITGPSGLGAFTGASHITESILRVLRTSGTFTVAAYARISGDERSVIRLLESHVRLFAGLLIVAGTVVVAVARELITFVFGPGFAPAATSLQFLAMAVLPIGISYALATSGHGTGELRLHPLLMVLIALSQALLAVIGGVLLSIAGVAFAQLVGWSVALVIYALEAGRRRAALAPDVLLRVATIAVPVFTAAMIVARSPLPVVAKLILAVATSSAVVVLFIVRPTERAIAWQLLPRRA